MARLGRRDQAIKIQGEDGRRELLDVAARILVGIQVLRIDEDVRRSIEVAARLISDVDCFILEREDYRQMVSIGDESPEEKFMKESQDV